MRWLALAAALVAAPAQADCRLALVLGLDVSGSVDDAEFAQQREGLARALESPAVREAFFAVPGTEVELYAFEWSGPLTQVPLVDWRAIRGPADLDAVATLLRAPAGPRRDPSTAIGQALVHARGAVARRDCWRRVIDLSGDGPNNAGPEPSGVDLPGVTVNGLVIGTQEMDYGGTKEQVAGELRAYYRAEVIRGPGAFAVIALGFEDYARAIEEKLVREVGTLPAAQN